MPTLKVKPDLQLLIIFLILLVGGLLVLGSASAVLSQQKIGNPYGFLKHQLIFGVLPGLLLGFIVYKVPYQKIQKLSLGLLVVVAIILTAVLIPGLQSRFGGAGRWISVGWLNFQPSELAKLGLLIYFSSYLAKKNKPKQQLFVVLAVLGLVSVLLILQPDLSTLIIIVSSCLAVYFLSGAKISYLLGVFGACITGLLVLIYSESYRLDRWRTFLNPAADKVSLGYQINQALLALGSGGFWGVGLGHSRQKFNYLPEPMGDSIFAVLGEELGFLGALVLLTLFVWLLVRAFQISQKANSDFGRLLSLGIGIWFFLQAFVNIAATCGLLPLAGLPLPFVSYGGSAMMVNLMAAGLLLNISKHNH